MSLAYGNVVFPRTGCIASWDVSPRGNGQLGEEAPSHQTLPYRKRPGECGRGERWPCSGGPAIQAVYPREVPTLFRDRDVQREILPIPDRPYAGQITYDAKDP